MLLCQGMPNVVDPLYGNEAGAHVYASALDITLNTLKIYLPDLKYREAALTVIEELQTRCPSARYNQEGFPLAKDGNTVYDYERHHEFSDSSDPNYTLTASPLVPEALFQKTTRVEEVR